MIDLDTKQLRSFLCLAMERSFSKAALQIGCSQATMSIRIQKLEDALGIRLFERGPHEVTLTAEGRDLLPDIRAIVDKQDRMYERTQSSREFGSVRLGVAEGYERTLLPGLLKHMLQNHAAAQLEVRCQPSWRLQQMIEARTLDLAVVTLLQEAPSAVTLCRTQLYWVASPGFELAPRVPVPIAWHHENCFFRCAGAAALKDQGVAYREVLCSADTRVVRAAVEAGTAVTVMAEGTLSETLRAISDPSVLPPLGTAPIQLLERPGLQSEASGVVKRKLVDAYRGAGALAH